MRFFAILSFLSFFFFGAAYAEMSDLAFAALDNDVEVINSLLNKGIDVDLQDEEGTTPLMRAVAYGQLNAVKLLLSKGAKVKRENKFGITAINWLGLMKKRNIKAILKLLLDKGADINHVSKDGRTPLTSAIGEEDQKITQLLLNNKADPNTKDSEGKTSLWELCYFEDLDTAKNILNLLLTNGLNINVIDNNGKKVSADKDCSENKALLALFKTNGLK